MRLAVDNQAPPHPCIDVRTFDEQAYACAHFMRKGSQIDVQGRRLTYEEWRNAENWRSATPAA